MNGIISISLLIVFLIVFGGYFLLNAIFPLDNAGMSEHSFFSNNAISQKQTIFLVGSSMVAQLNVTKIDQIVSESNQNFTVYNLAYNGDTPNKRITNVDKLILMKPKIVVYGVSYDTFSLSYEEID